MQFRVCAAFLLLLSHSLWAAATDVSAPTAPGYLPLWRRPAPSITDLALIYQGGTHRPQWTTNRFAPYVTYRLRDAGKEQWLFDGFLMIEFQDGRRNTYQPDSKMTPARREHWEWLLDRTFAGDDGVPMLVAACRAAAKRIGEPLRRRQVVLTLPVPIPGQTNWGELDGRALDFRHAPDRLLACDWYLNQALDRWRTLGPRQLDLAGFYWVQEDAASTHEFLGPLARSVHQRKLGFFWIPYWQPARSTANWRECGFDAAWQQPNHFFHPEVPDARLEQACDFARRHGMGLEMEFDTRVLSDPKVFAPRLTAYLDTFTRKGVRDLASVAWYEGGGAIYELATSTQPEMQAHYDHIARFILRRQHLADAAANREP